jgi:hypothetical protein
MPKSFARLAINNAFSHGLSTFVTLLPFLEDGLREFFIVGVRIIRKEQVFKVTGMLA